MRRLAAAFSVGIALSAAVSASATAPKAPVFGLRAVGNPARGYFVYTMTPGAARTGAIIVSNVGSAAGTVHLFTADATTGPTSGTVYKTDTAPTGAGTWVTLAHTSFPLAPGGHRQVPFTVHVPTGAKAGQWVAGIVAETEHKVAAQKPGQKAHVQITIRDLTIVAVQVNVPGPPLIAFAIGKVTTGGAKGFQKVIVHFANTGNVLVKPHGVVTIFDSTGKVIQVLPYTMDSFLPQTEIDYPLLLKKALGPGDYVAGVHLVAPGVAGAATKVVTSRPSFSVSKSDVEQVFTSSNPTQAPPASSSSSSSSGVPTWVYIVAGAAVVVLLALLLLLLLRRRRAARRRTPPETFVRLPPGPEPAAAPVPLVTESKPEPEPEPAPAATNPACVPYHYWDVAYDRGVLGSDGVWRFPHRCRNCGLELMARDIDDATSQAQQLPQSG
jgi:MYXO-CTERM domain-containing protein